MVRVENQITDIDNLLAKFNDREVVAFKEIYSMFYDDLFYYALKLYENTDIEPQDAVHDTFLNLWKLTRTKFDSMAGLKAYLFVAIRNEFNQNVRHRYYVERYKKQELETRVHEYDMLESELRGSCRYMLELLPDEYAEILRLFFEGLNTEEIALKLGKSTQQIYKKKRDIIAILRKKVSREDFFIFILLLSRL